MCEGRWHTGEPQSGGVGSFCDIRVPPSKQHRVAIAPHSTLTFPGLAAANEAEHDVSRSRARCWLTKRRIDERDGLVYYNDIPVIVRVWLRVPAPHSDLGKSRSSNGSSRSACSSVAVRWRLSSSFYTGSGVGRRCGTCAVRLCRCASAPLPRPTPPPLTLPRVHLLPVTPLHRVCRAHAWMPAHRNVRRDAVLAMCGWVRVPGRDAVLVVCRWVRVQ